MIVILPNKLGSALLVNGTINTIKVPDPEAYNHALFIIDKNTFQLSSWHWISDKKFQVNFDSKVDVTHMNMGLLIA